MTQEQACKDFDVIDTLHALQDVGEVVAPETVEAWDWNQRREVRAWCYRTFIRRNGADAPEMERPAWMPEREGAA